VRMCGGGGCGSHRPASPGCGGATSAPSCSCVTVDDVSIIAWPARSPACSEGGRDGQGGWRSKHRPGVDGISITPCRPSDRTRAAQVGRGLWSATRFVLVPRQVGSAGARRGIARARRPSTPPETASLLLSSGGRRRPRLRRAPLMNAGRHELRSLLLACWPWPWKKMRSEVVSSRGHVGRRPRRKRRRS